MDNSATTRCSERAKNKMVQILTEDYGNPSSLHNMGKTAEDYIKEAKEQIAKTLRCDEKEIIFTSGGTESNNMALIGFDKQEIVEISEKIDAYETSILPYEDCCTIFVAKHPVTKPSLNVIHNDERKLSEKIDALMQEAIDTVEVIHIEA